MGHTHAYNGCAAFSGCGSIHYDEAAHDAAISWKHFPRYWPFVRGIHRSPVNFPHKGQWRGALMFSLICNWINGWVNNREPGELRRHCAHYDVIVMHTTDAPPFPGVVPFIMMKLPIVMQNATTCNGKVHFSHGSFLTARWYIYIYIYRRATFGSTNSLTLKSCKSPE